MSKFSYAVMFHKITEPAWNLRLIGISDNLDAACKMVYEDFDSMSDDLDAVKKDDICLKGSQRLESDNGYMYLVVDLLNYKDGKKHINIEFDRYYIFEKEEP